LRIKERAHYTPDNALIQGCYEGV